MDIDDTNKNVLLDIINKIDLLNQNEKKHILKFLISNNINYTKNINGYFFNLAGSNVSQKLLENLKTKIILIETHRNEIITVDTMRDSMIKQCKELIENNLQDTIKLKVDEYNNKIKMMKENDNIDMQISKIILKNINKIVYDENFLIKKPVYHKNSVYQRILGKMKTQSYKKKERIHDTFNDNENDENDQQINKIEIDDVDDNYDVVLDDENVILDDENLDLDIENVDLDIENVDLDIENDDINSHDDNDDNVSNTSNDICFENEKSFEKEKSYYKKLLNTHGFKFDVDKSCMLVYQEYIN